MQTRATCLILLSPSRWSTMTLVRWKVVPSFREMDSSYATNLPKLNASETTTRSRMFTTLKYRI
jgi:hypothetical protein